MAIFNPTVAGGGGAWNVASYNGSSAGSNELTGFSFFTLDGEPKKWCLVGIMSTSGSWYSNTSTGYITGACRTDRTTYISGYSVSASNGVRFYRVETNRISTSYTESTRKFYISINNTGSYTFSLAFPMKRSSYYLTWYLFYTV